MNLVTRFVAKYKGYDLKTKQFVFMQDNGIKHKLYHKEFGWFVDNLVNFTEVVAKMNPKVDRKFVIISWYPSTGYYILSKVGKLPTDQVYNLIHGEDNTDTGVQYNSISQVPTHYKNQPIYKYRFKKVFAELDV